MKKILEEISPSLNVGNADITTARTGSYVDASVATKIAAIGFGIDVAETKKITLQLMQAKDADGTDEKVLGGAVSKTSAADDSDLLCAAEVSHDELDADNGFTYVAAKISSDNATAVVGGAVLLKGGLRHGGPAATYS